MSERKYIENQIWFKPYGKDAEIGASIRIIESFEEKHVIMSYIECYNHSPEPKKRMEFVKSILTSTLSKWVNNHNPARLVTEEFMNEYIKDFQLTY